MLAERATGLRETKGGKLAGDHLPTELEIERWPTYTEADPLSILLSACLGGALCGADGSSYGAPFAHLDQLLGLPNVRTVAFCPEDFAFGTPRMVPDIHGGGGEDVLDGRASVRSESGEDWTTAMIDAAEAMLSVAVQHGVRLAVLMDISAACGTQVIYRGARSGGEYQAAHGVCAALLLRNGITVVSQRDFRTLGRIRRRLDATFTPDPEALDHHEIEWYRSYFGRS